MPSYLDEDGTKVWPSNVTKLDVAGNSFADKYAALAAEAVQVPFHVATDCKFNYNLVKKIQWRIMTIVTYLPERRICKTIRAPKEVAQDLDSRLAKTNHVLSRDRDSSPVQIVLRVSKLMISLSTTGWQASVSRYQTVVDQSQYVDLFI